MGYFGDTLIFFKIKKIFINPYSIIYCMDFYRKIRFDKNANNSGTYLMSIPRDLVKFLVIDHGTEVKLTPRGKNQILVEVLNNDDS